MLFFVLYSLVISASNVCEFQLNKNSNISSSIKFILSVMFLCEGGVAYHINIFGLHGKQHIDRGAWRDATLKTYYLQHTEEGEEPIALKYFLWREFHSECCLDRFLSNLVHWQTTSQIACDRIVINIKQFVKIINRFIYNFPLNWMHNGVINPF